MELLAPAGNPAALEAAVHAGADAVYLGLSRLNARRGAANFTPAEFRQAVQDTHAAGARVYLTLNTDVLQRELRDAARLLCLAAEAGADAVLVRDPAVMALWRAMPESGRPALHASTQAATLSSADVRMLRELGASRVVLAREMSLAEIRAASEIGVETEVFVQGALCFCVSGRCLLSSWGGGRSGNRGTCVSPCRVPWTVEGQAAGTPMAMRDLSLAGRLRELADAGVAAVKIEGRLKTAAWVAEAVGLYREALGKKGGSIPAPRAEWHDAGKQLARYAGRDVTDGYLDGHLDSLTGEAGRPASMPVEVSSAPAAKTDAPPATTPTATVTATIDERGIVFSMRVGERAGGWRLPRTVVKRAEKAVALGDFLAGLVGETFHGVKIADASTSALETLLPPRNANRALAELSAFLRSVTRAPDDLPDTLPEDMKKPLAARPSHSANVHALGSRPRWARLSASDFFSFRDNLPDAEGFVIEGLAPEDIDHALETAGAATLIAALPSLLFENDLSRAAALVEACRARNIAVEANGWSGVWLAREAKARFTTGPGLGILNALAAETPASLGAEVVTLSLEADRAVLEDVSARLSVPATLWVYGRPPLVYSRISAEMLGPDGVWEDRRGIRLRRRGEGSVTVFRPESAFDWRGLRNRKIRVARVGVDLVAATDVVTEWRRLGGNERFNYDRGLA